MIAWTHSRRLPILIASVLLITLIVTGCSASPAVDVGRQGKELPRLPDGEFADHPSGAAFVECAIAARGSDIAITDEMRARFDLFARDYRLIYLPHMDGYESFFETSHYGNTYGFPNFADAVFYVLAYMGHPESVTGVAMEEAVRKLFFAHHGTYEAMPHQAYRKFARYDDGHYSPWPEGGLDHARQFYLLTALEVTEAEGAAVDIRVRTKTYYFHDPAVYQAGDRENWLEAQAKELGLPELEAATRLIASGDMAEIEGVLEFETTIRVDPDGPRGFNPQFVSSRSREIACEPPFEGD